MKKIVSILLVLVTVLSMGTMAFADGTTTLTTTVPDATYTLNIPANQTVAFNATSHSLDIPTVTGASGFAVGKNILVTITSLPFSNPNVNTSIPYELLLAGNHYPDGAPAEYLLFIGKNDNGVSVAKYDFNEELNGGIEEVTELWLAFDAANWGKALGGDYTATITFTSEVVAAE